MSEHPEWAGGSCSGDDALSEEEEKKKKLIQVESQLVKGHSDMERLSVNSASLTYLWSKGLCCRGLPLQRCLKYSGWTIFSIWAVQAKASAVTCRYIVEEASDLLTGAVVDGVTPDDVDDKVMQQRCYLSRLKLFTCFNIDRSDMFHCSSRRRRKQPWA